MGHCMAFGSGGINSTCVWRGKVAELHIKNTMPTVKHEGGKIMLWDCSSAKGIGRRILIKKRMNGVIYCEILSKNVLLPSIREWKTKQCLILHHDKDPKHITWATNSCDIKSNIYIKKIICGGS